MPEEVGGVKVSDMPIGPEALSVPGRRDGQTKMVKWPKESKITAHTWSEGKLLINAFFVLFLICELYISICIHFHIFDFLTF